MENKGSCSVKAEGDDFLELICKAQNGDEAALMELLHIFGDDIHYLARFTHLPYEDAVQSIKAEFIHYIKNVEDE